MSFATRTDQLSMAGFIHRAGCDTAPIPGTGRRTSACNHPLFMQGRTADLVSSFAGSAVISGVVL